MMACSTARATSGFAMIFGLVSASRQACAWRSKQPSRVARGRAQNKRGWRRPEGFSQGSVAVPFELRRRETDQTPATRPCGSLMEPLGTAVKHDLTRLQLHAAPNHRPAPQCCKSDKDERRSQRDIGDPREVLLAAKEIEVIQPGARRAGFEFASIAYKKEIERYPAQARLVVIWVDKGACAASWHPLSLQASRRKVAGPTLGTMSWL